jgi:TPR repeat protein
LFTRGSELEGADAYYNLGMMYNNGDFMKNDQKQCLYHWEQAAVLGSEIARYNLGVDEHNKGDITRAM